MERAARHRDPARRARPRSCAALEFGVADARRRARRHRARLPPRRRHPRGRPDRGGRAHRRAREAAGDAAVAPRRRPACSTPEQRLRRRAEDALAGAGLSEVVGWSVHRARPASTGCASRPTTGAAGRGAATTRCPRTCRCCARRCSARCSTSRSATARAGRRDMRLFEIGAIFIDQRAPARGRRPRSAGSRCPRSAITSARCSRARCGRRRGARATRRGPTSSRPRPCSRRVLDALRVAVAR